MILLHLFSKPGCTSHGLLQWILFMFATTRIPSQVPMSATCAPDVAYIILSWMLNSLLGELSAPSLASSWILFPCSLATHIRFPYDGCGSCVVTRLLSTHVNFLAKYFDTPILVLRASNSNVGASMPTSYSKHSLQSGSQCTIH